MSTNATASALAARALPRSAWRRALRTAGRHKGGTIGLVIIVLVTVVAVAAPVLAPHPPNIGELTARLLPPSWADGGSRTHLLGTDQLGRDTLSRLLFGARISLVVGLTAVLVSSVIGVVLGLVGGYFGGWVDTVISTAVNVILTFPFILLALTVIAVLGPSFRNVIIVLGITAWPIFTRVIRNQVLSLREREYVQAARALGFGHARIILGHIVPNLTGTMLVLASIQVARMILNESFLSFLGLGIQPPQASWGSMLGDGRQYILTDWWLAGLPGLAIFITTLGINLLGDGLRDLLDPQTRSD